MRTISPIRPTAAFAAAIALTLGLAACSGAGPTDGATTPTPTQTQEQTDQPMEESTDTSAVTPQGTGNRFVDARTAAQHMPGTAATLTGGFVSALGIAAAAATLDENSVALSDAVGSLAGEEKGAAFLDLWRTHIGYFVDYAVAVKGGDTAARDAALA
ncbi:MAG: hypothetical protein JJE50_12240, partial [Actinomycetales bacterium]|nr:hypothetical protein [Actinomycetales bacterium]